MHASRLQVLGVSLAGLLLAVLLVAAGFLGRMVVEGPNGRPVATTAKLDPEFIREIIGILSEDFVEPDRADPLRLFDGAIRGIFSEALKDPHSGYISPNDYALARNDFSGAFSGIGATVNQAAAAPGVSGRYVVIQRVLPSTPAERAGLREGDTILTVNGESAEGWTVQQAVLKIRGPRGTSVALKVRRADRSEQTFTITRDEVLVASVSTTPPVSGGRFLDAVGSEVTDLAYIHILIFTSRTPKEVSDLITAANNAGKKGLIIDVRGNPGGLLNETAQIADFFLDRGTIVSQIDREGRRQSIEARSGRLTELPVVIVQDKNSASGSEVLAAALADNGRATVIGTRSFGKGTVNHYRDLSNGGAIYVSIARWLTPNGDQIEGQGIAPAVEIDMTLDDIQAGRDTQVFRAIDLLRSSASVQQRPG